MREVMTIVLGMSLTLGLAPRMNAGAPPTSSARVVEDWSVQPPASPGIPAGWRPYATFGGRPAYRFTVTTEGGQRALLLQSEDEHSTIAKEIHVSLAATPILEWSWKIVALPAGADIRQKATSDLTGHLLVVWPRPPALLRSRLIAYAWDAAAPAGSIQPSRKTGMVTFIVLHSGPRDLGQWITERRNVADDYRTVFGETAPDPRAIALSIDTNDTHASAAAFIGPIVFRSP
jgi:DUF3047 family protein